MDPESQTVFLNIFISGLALIAAVDLVLGLRKGRLRLVGADREASPVTFWSYAALEASLVFFVLSLWVFP
jgi:hypothetical protein